MTVMSTTEYERLICEINFVGKKLGVIVSEEVPGQYEVSVFPDLKDPRAAFNGGERHEAIAVDYFMLVEALNEAVERLRALDRPRGQD